MPTRKRNLGSFRLLWDKDEKEQGDKATIAREIVSKETKENDS